MGAIQVLSKTACAISMVRRASARLTIAGLLLTQEDCVSDMVAAARKFATLRAARRVLKRVGVAKGMVRMGGASLVDAPPLHDKGSSIASHTAAGRLRGRAPWQAASPALVQGVSVVNTAAAEVNTESQAAPAECTAFSRPARRTAGEGTASTHQDASHLQPSTAQTARCTPIRRRGIERKMNGKSFCGHVYSSALSIK